ncbi:DUF7662 domain-containing protein [Burkholderia stabilis]|uniref:DUF7662 domain-containing protein n=1 Tax=Burkholderia stabilis TaxID=95485 RepID=UPI001F4B8742|nr:hypothetical protein [Burkholderia stabilis]
MAKYFRLTGHLEALEQDNWKARFIDVEAILGFRLPPSARKFREWWGNDTHNGRPWRAAGWRTEDVDVIKETITFSRCEAVTVKRPVKEKPVAAVSKSYEWDLPTRMECKVTMEWQPLGKLTINESGRLSFPQVDAVPAIYRFRIRTAEGAERNYVGEAVDMKRRFGNYRNPGSTQQTSLRINATLKEALAAGAEVSVSAVFQNRAWLHRNGDSMTVNFQSKAVRCVFENAAILDGAGSDIESLNRAGSKD